MQSSEAAKPVRYDQDLNINQRIIKSGEGERGKTIMKLAKEWSLTDEEVADGPDGWVRKLEEVAVLVTLLACGSGRTGKNAKVDFFLVSPDTCSMLALVSCSFHASLETTARCLLAHELPLRIHRISCLPTSIYLLETTCGRLIGLH